MFVYNNKISSVETTDFMTSYSKLLLV